MAEPTGQIDLSAGIEEPTTPAPAAKPIDLSAGIEETPKAGVIGQVGSAITDVAKGAGAGLVETGMGLGELGHKAIHATLPKGVAETLSPTVGMQAERALAKPAMETATEAREHPFSAKGVGYAGETLSEFLLGDAALKDLSVADKLLQTGKVAKILQSSPRLIQALKLGAEAMRMGTTQAAQTYARTGEAGEAVKAGAEMTAAAGTLGVAGKAVGAIGERLAETKSTLEKLAEEGRIAKSSDEARTALSDTLNNAEKRMHDEYEDGYQRLKQIAGNTEISAQSNPLSDAAKLILKSSAKEEAATHPTVRKASGMIGKGLDPEVRDLLSDVANGTKDVLDAEGKPTKTLSEGYKLDDLIKIRQTLRTLADEFDYGDINSRTIRRLLPKVNETVGKLAEQTGNKDAKAIYDGINASYGPQARVFQDSTFIDNLREGKYTHVADQLFSGAKVVDKINDLKSVLNPTEMEQLGRNIFGVWEKAAEGDPAKLVKEFFSAAKKAGPDGLDTLFGGFKDEGQKIMQSAERAKTVQQALKGTLILGGLRSHLQLLEYASMLVGGAALFGKDGGVLGALVNNPTLWKYLGYAGKGLAKAGPAAAFTGKVAAQQAVQDYQRPASEAVQPAVDRARRVMEGARGVL